METRDTRYAWNGDVSLAYQIVGAGGTDLLYIPGAMSNVEVMWESARYRRFLERLGSFCRLIVMDRRGYGCSDRFSPNDVPPLEVMVDDVVAVLDETDSDRTALFSSEESNFIACMIAASRPDRVSHLVLHEPEPTFIRDDEITWAWSHREWDAQIDFVRSGWGQHRFTEERAREAFPSIVGDDRELRWLTRFQRLTASPGVAVAEMRKYCETDIRGVLPTIHVPTLVLHRETEAFVEAASPRYVADHIAGSRFVQVPGSDYTPWGEEMEPFVEEIEEFVTGVRHPPETDLILATVLFTDIVGSTEKQASLGDRGWKALVEQHHELIRTALERWRGVEHDTAGDGFYATFDGPARAIRCAREIVRQVRELGVEIRVGIHTGECQLINDKVGGIAVTIGARISVMAGPSQVLVSQTVKDLVAGSGLSFEDAGERELKGIPDRWRLYSVVGR